MASCLQASMNPLITRSSLISPPPLSFNSPGRRNLKSFRYSFRVKAGAKMPPINPNDPFLLKLASVAAKSPEKLLNRPVNGDMPPFLDDVYDFPSLMAAPSQAARSEGYRGQRRQKTRPPDLPSILLDNRIVFLGMPLVPAVTELIIAQLFYLQYDDPKERIYLYINSTGTTRDDGETVGLESEGFAIYDVLASLKNEIHTICLGAAIGHACLFLAAGTKGYRSMLPHATAMIQQPRVPSSGLMPASDVFIRAREAKHNKDNLERLLAKHTGNSLETISNAMRRPFYMGPMKAKEFGVIDKVLWRGQEYLMPPEELEEKKAQGVEL